MGPWHKSKKVKVKVDSTSKTNALARHVSLARFTCCNFVSLIAKIDGK